MLLGMLLTEAAEQSSRPRPAPHQLCNKMNRAFWHDGQSFLTMDKELPDTMGKKLPDTSVHNGQAS